MRPTVKTAVKTAVRAALGRLDCSRATEVFQGVLYGAQGHWGLLYFLLNAPQSAHEGARMAVGNCPGHALGASPRSERE